MLSSIFDKLLGRRPNPTEHWPRVSMPAPDINLSQGTIGPLRFGDDLASANVFGRPDMFRWTQSDYCQLVYAGAGFQIDFDSGKLACAAFFVGPDTHLPVGASFSKPRFFPSARFSKDTSQKEIEAVFGAPKSRDCDDDEILLFYEVKALTIEFECTPAGLLKRSNIYPTEES